MNHISTRPSYGFISFDSLVYGLLKVTLYFDLYTLMYVPESVLSVVRTRVRPQAFSVVFQKAVLKAELDEALKQRVSNLIDSITSSVFQYTTRGLFEFDKLTYIAQLTFQVGRGGAVSSSAWCVWRTS